MVGFLLLPGVEHFTAPGKMNTGHERLACDSCHRPAPGTVRQQLQANARYLLGLLFNRKQRFSEAVKELETAGKMLPNSPRIHLQLGAALLQLSKLEEAERQLLAAYRIAGAEMGAAQFLLGELYFAQKKYENAMRAFEQYLADVPKAPNAAQVLSVVEKIRAALKQK